jgi:uncharacterized protein (TIGR02588 family)
VTDERSAARRASHARAQLAGIEPAPQAAPPGAPAEATAEADRGAARGPRRVAEWLSFGISLALVLALVAHLLWRMRQPVPDAPLARVTPRLDRTRELDGHFVLPLDVSNPGPVTVQDVQVRIRYHAPGAATESMDLVVDYVGRASTHTVFAYFDRDPRRLAIEAEVLSAGLD